MAKFRFENGGSDADWEEHLYHRSLPVYKGVVETDDELDIDALLRRGWEPLVEEDDAGENRSRRNRVAPAATE